MLEGLKWSVAALVALVLGSCATQQGGGGAPEPPRWLTAAEDFRAIADPWLDLWEVEADASDRETITAARVAIDGLFDLSTASSSAEAFEALLPRIDELLVARGDDEEKRARKIALMRSGLAAVRAALSAAGASASS